MTGSIRPSACDAEAKLILANIAYNFDRLIFHERARAAG
jgi:IS5 family transposase